MAKKVSESQVTMTELVLPQHTNSLGSVFGGVVMSWIDICAAIAAHRHCRSPVVTASIDGLEFLKPVFNGWILSLKASVNYVGKTSMEVGVLVESENPLTGECHRTASAYLTFVALGDDYCPKTIPAIEPETEDEKRRFHEAQIRRKQRLKLRELTKK